MAREGNCGACGNIAMSEHIRSQLGRIAKRCRELRAALDRVETLGGVCQARVADTLETIEASLDKLLAVTLPILRVEPARRGRHKLLSNGANHGPAKK